MQNDYADILVGNQVFFSDRNGDLPTGRYTILEIEGTGPVNEDTIIRMINEEGIELRQPAVNVNPVYARIQLTVDATFELFNTPPRYLEENLKRLIQYGIENGMLTADTAAELQEGYTITTEEMPAVQPRREVKVDEPANMLLPLIKPIVADLEAQCLGGKMVLFVSSLKEQCEQNRMYHDYSGQRAWLIRAIYSADTCLGEDLYDQEALPAFRLRFADGVEFDAFPEELPELEIAGGDVGKTVPSLVLADRISRAFGKARDLGYQGLDHIGAFGSDDEKQAVLDIIKG